MVGTRTLAPSTEPQLRNTPSTRFKNKSILGLKATAEPYLEDIPSVSLQSDGGPLAPLPDSWAQPGVYACFDKEGDMQYVAMSRKVSESIANHLQVLPAEDFASVKMKLWEKPTRSELEETARGWIEQCIDRTGDAPPGNTKEVDIWRKKASEVARAKANVEFREGAVEEEATAEIERIISRYLAVLFIKGTRQAPQCGFSDATIHLFNQLGVDYECVDTLDEERNPGLRDAIKNFSQWPTIPQVYVGGEFMGGADVCREMAESGELQEILEEVMKAKAQPPPSFVTLPPKAVHSLMSSDASLPFIDCRTPPEWQAGRVKGAINIPAFLDGPNGRQPVRDSFVAAVKEQFPATDTRLVLGCQRAIRSKDAAAWLCAEGYSNILELDGGFSWWVADDDLPVEA